MGCEQWRGKLDAYADGELDPAETNAVGTHLGDARRVPPTCWSECR
jgi:anti-sigma factor RsiW